MIPPLARGITRPSGIVVPGEPRWGPSSVPGLALWLDADDYTGTSWLDRSPNARNFVVPAGANEPADSTHTTGDGRTVGAVTFDDANTEALEIDEAIFTAYPATIIAVVVPDDATVDGTILSVADKDAAGDYWAVQCAGAVAGDPVRVVSSASGSAVNADTTTGFAAEPIVVVAKLTSAISRTAQLDGAGDGSETTSNTPAGADRTSIGRLGDSTPSNYFSGKVLLVLAYDRALPDGEILALADWAHREKIHNPGLGIPALGLVLDLDPSDASTLTITSSPDVDEIENRANKGITSLSQATAANKPHLDSINGLGALLFDSSASQRLSASAAAVSGIPFTFLTVFAPTTTDAAGAVLSVSDNTNVNRIHAPIVRGDLSGDPVQLLMTGGGAVAPQGGVGIDPIGDPPAAYVFAGVSAGATSHRAWLNGVAGAESTGTSGPSGLTRTDLGAHTSSAMIPFGGLTGRALVYKRALSTTERQQAERTLMARYGVGQ